MSSGFTLEPRDGYLYVQLAPGFEMGPESTTRVWAAICDTCRERGLRRALACVFPGYVPDEQSRFFQTAALNRGVRMEFFPDLNAALQWLGLGARAMD